MKRLNLTQIQELAARAGVKRIAVENFLSSLDPSLTQEEQVANAMMDARSYRWNHETTGAIREGIALAYKPVS